MTGLLQTNTWLNIWTIKRSKSNILNRRNINKTMLNHYCPLLDTAVFFSARQQNYALYAPGDMHLNAACCRWFWTGLGVHILSSYEGLQWRNHDISWGTDTSSSSSGCLFHVPFFSTHYNSHWLKALSLIIHTDKLKSNEINFTEGWCKVVLLEWFNSTCGREINSNWELPRDGSG